MPGSLQARASRVQGPATRPWRCSSWPKHRGSCRASSDTPGLGTTHGLCPLFPRPCRCLGGRGGGPWPAPRCPGRLPPPSHTAVGERRRPKARPGALHQASWPPGGQRREGPGHLLSCGPRKARLAVPRRAERLLSNASLGGQHMSTPGHTRGTLSGAHATRTHARARAHTHPARARAADGPVPRLTVSCPSRINAISCTHHY